MLRDFLVQRVLRGLVRRANNIRIAAMARRIARREPLPTGPPVIFFRASTGIDDLSWNSGFHLLAAWALRLQGVPVVHFACNAGMSHCVLGTNRDHPHKPPPCKSCVYQSRTLHARASTHWFEMDRDPQLERALQELNLPELITFKWRSEGIEFDAPLALGAWCLPSLRWILRRHHLTDDDTTRHLLREYILSAWNVARKFSVLLDQERPRAVVVFNGQFFPEATARQLARQRGIPVITHEVGLQPASAFFTHGDATAYPVHIPPDFELNAEQSAQLDTYLERRFQGEFSMAGVKFWPRMRGLDQTFLERAARFRQIVTVFTNVVFDTSQPHANVLFEDMFDWLDLLLERSRAHPETLFVIRAHPDELRTRKASRETAAGWFEASGAKAASNLAFIGPDEGLSSYEFISRSKFVMVYNSTIGLEASLMGAPVLCAGRARFTQYPIVFFPGSVGEFQAKLEELLAADKIDVPAAFRRNALRFLYYQLFRTSLPFEKFLRPSVRTTQTRLKSFGTDALLPSNSPAMKAILEGLLEGGPFLLGDAGLAPAVPASRVG
jgi:hypothetical protein